MTYDNYVESIKDKSIFKNIILPVIVVFFSISINGLLLFVMPAELNLGGSISIAYVITMFLSVFLTLMLIRVVSKFEIVNLGFSKEKITGSYFFGSFLGMLSVSIVFLVIYLTNSVEVLYVFENKFIFSIIVALVFFIFQGMFEEIIVRGYLMVHFSKIMGSKTAILVTSLVFAFLHALNPNVKVLPLINIFIFGMVFAILYYTTGNMWLVGAAHSFWNFTLGIIYGSNVSGMQIDTTVLKTVPKGNVIFNGAEFGFEGSIVTAILGVVCILVLLKYNSNHKNSENTKK